MTDRVNDDNLRTNGLRHSWRRITVVEEADSEGHLEDRRTKEHLVVARQGDEESTLVKLNDKEPAVRERERERRHEAENREKYAPRSGRPSQRRGKLELDATLIQRFRYQWLSNEVVDGRWTYVLAFAPPGEVEGGQVADRILGNLGGRIWVDAEVFEVARIDANLLKRIKIGGFIAEVSDLGFLIDRRPLPDGPWVDIKLESHAAGRKLFARFSGRMEIRQEDFAPLPAESAKAVSVQ
ncbi:MAG TPA: hypothetical protein PLX89_03380 [Verrucomicrobiota bacterium]|nr:hypothetical protein [Verrucomicrobiales bacterium]HRI12025.1 hypothetical protein [Verrucomicrobiota bacterium]